MYKIKLSSLIVLCFLVLLVSACKSTPSSMLTDTTCLPPCWQGITPGQSTKQDVLRILPTLSSVDASTIKDSVSFTKGRNDNIYWISNSSAGDYGGRVYFRNGIVSVIDLGPKPGSLSFSEAVQKLGKPESYLAYPVWGDNRKLIVHILYPSKGYALEGADDNFDVDKPAKIIGNQPVRSFIYFNSTDFNEVMTNGPIDLLDPGDLQLKIHPWIDFGILIYN